MPKLSHIWQTENTSLKSLISMWQNSQSLGLAVALRVWHILPGHRKSHPTLCKMLKQAWWHCSNMKYWCPSFFFPGMWWHYWCKVGLVGMKCLCVLILQGVDLSFY